MGFTAPMWVAFQAVSLPLSDKEDLIGIKWGVSRGVQFSDCRQTRSAPIPQLNRPAFFRFSLNPSIDIRDVHRRQSISPRLPIWSLIRSHQCFNLNFFYSDVNFIGHLIAEAAGLKAVFQLLCTSGAASDFGWILRWVRYEQLLMLSRLIPNSHQSHIANIYKISRSYGSRSIESVTHSVPNGSLALSSVA